MKSLFINILLGPFIHIRFGMIISHEIYKKFESNYLPSLQPHQVPQRRNICEVTMKCGIVFVKKTQERYGRCMTAIYLLYGTGKRYLQSRFIRLYLLRCGLH